MGRQEKRVVGVFISPGLPSRRVLHHLCKILLTLPIPTNKLFMNSSLGTLAGALTDPVTAYLIKLFLVLIYCPKVEIKMV